MATDRTLSRDRRFPTLLDRLIGQPLQSSTARREAFLADLEWLLNARSERFPGPDGRSLFEIDKEDSDATVARKQAIASSVLNYGIPDLSGRIVSALNQAELEADIRTALERFEPRLTPGKLEVEVMVDEEVGSVGFAIRGEVQSLEQVEDRFFLMVNVDLSTGRCSFAADEKVI